MPKPKQLKRHLPLLILLLGCAVLIVANLIWVHTETRPPHWDMGRHLYGSLQYLQLAKLAPFRLMALYIYYPPLIYLVTIPFYLIFGTSLTTAVAANSCFLVVGALAVYGIGRRVGNRTIGLLSALVYATSPLIATQSKEFQIDGPLAAMTAVTVWLLIRSPDFKNRLNSLGVGILIGLSLLCKWTFPGIIALPLAYAVGLAAIRSYRERDLSRLINIALAAIIVVAIDYAWYIPHLHQLHLDTAANNGPQAAKEGDPTGLSLRALSYYALNLLNVQLYLVPTVLFLIGLWYALKRRSHELNLLLALIAGTYLFFTIVSNKDPRYTLPFIGAIAVIAVFWTQYLKRRPRLIVQGAIAIYAILTFWAMSFGLPLLPKAVAFTANDARITLWAQHGYIISQPSGQNWHLEPAFQAAAGSTLAYSGPDTIWFNSYAMMYYATKEDVTIVASPSQARYYLLRTAQRPIAIPKGFIQLTQHPLPDGGTVTLYRRTL
jgi:4-amino-4-deoxy-L-arabinose transferase-like glycosyltransferase